MNPEWVISVLTTSGPRLIKFRPGRNAARQDDLQDEPLRVWDLGTIFRMSQVLRVWDLGTIFRMSVEGLGFRDDLQNEPSVEGLGSRDDLQDECGGFGI